MKKGLFSCKILNGVPRGIRTALSLLLFSTLIASVQAQSEGSFSIDKRDFNYLFNHHRVGAPQQLPWIGSWWAFRDNGIDAADGFGQSESPAKRFDEFFQQGDRVGQWERDNHTCDKLSDEDKEGCQGWWGHCDAWSAAAIKEVEPRQGKVVRHPQLGHEKNFSVADLKAYVTEMWMQRTSLFVGSTNKSVVTETDWVFDAEHPTAKKWSGGKTTYDSFWDVTPRTFFLVLTNYIGIKKVGLVIDRFTGDQVWNQPLAGYRFLPIRSEDIHPQEVVGGTTVYPVTMRVKFYWADDGLPHGDITEDFDIHKTLDEEQLENDHQQFHGRFLKFKLFFDSEVRVSADGKQVLAAGKIIGDGIWHHQEVQGQGYDDMDETHPDFIWSPVSLPHQGRANPYLGQKNVYYLLKYGEEGSAGGEDSRPLPLRPTLVQVEFHNPFDQIPGLAEYAEYWIPLYRYYKMQELVQTTLIDLFNREGIGLDLRKKDITVDSEKKTCEVLLTFPQGIKVDKAQKILEQAGFRVSMKQSL